MALLTENNPHGDFGMGDRALALFYGPYGEIEGKWTYVYFSYSNVNHKAYAFIELSGE